MIEIVSGGFTQMDDRHMPNPICTYPRAIRQVTHDRWHVVRTKPHKKPTLTNWKLFI